MSGLGILVGPGVVRHDGGAGLRRFAARVGCGVVNTWGAKGVFPWDDPHHFGTAGLQARDFELAGLADVDVLVTSGLDPAEVTSRPWSGRAEVIEVAPAELADLDRQLPPGTLVRPALYRDLAAVVGPMYEQPGSPPARAAELAARLPADGVVVADPGLVGFWIARTFPTRRPGSVIVPASGGIAAADRAAAQAEAAGRPVVRLHDDGWPETDLDPGLLVAVAGPIVAWSDAD